MPLLVLLTLSLVTACLTGLWVGRRHDTPQRSPAWPRILAIAGTLTLAALAGLVLADPDALGVDASVAHWAYRHATAFSTDGLDAVTRLGSALTIVMLGSVVAIVELRRSRSVWVVVFHVDRARPTFDPIAARLDPAFPSGHSAAWAPSPAPPTPR